MELLATKSDKVADIFDRFLLFVKPGVSQEELEKMYAIYSVNFDHDVTFPGFLNGELTIIPNTVAEYLGSNTAAKIVDACAGTGLLGEKISKLGYTNLTAIDGSAEMLEEAKKKNIYNDYICAWIGNRRLPIPNDTFDALCTANAFYENHLRPDCLLEFIRIVKPGGFIILGVAEANLITVEALRSLESTMKFYEDKGLWKMMLRKVVSNFCEGLDTGVIFCFTPLEAKKIIGGQ